MMVRRLQLIVIGGVLAVAAFTTGEEFLYFLLYLGLAVGGGSYVMTRFGLADLEAGYVLDRLHAEVGDTLRATYTVRNSSRLPKPSSAPATPSASSSRTRGWASRRP
jgi:hypothetical protein